LRKPKICFGGLVAERTFDMATPANSSRRPFVKRMAHGAPAILAAAPDFAEADSGKNDSGRPDGK